MRLTALALGLVSLGACATSGVATSGSKQLVSGENGDLRVFTDHKCPGKFRLDEQWATYHQTVDRISSGQERPKALGLGGLGGVAVELLSGIGGIAFKSFGTFLHEAGAPSTTQSSGATGGYFFTEVGADETIDISPQMKCVYLVRNGFALKPIQFAPTAPEDLRRKWTDLGLNKTPDLFAVLHLETTADAELITRLPDWLNSLKATTPTEKRPAMLQLSPPAPYFRAKIDRLYVREFQHAQVASDYRDLAVVLNYALPGSQQRNSPERGADSELAAASEPGSMLAAGGISLFGMQKGDYREDLLVGLSTGWMRMPMMSSRKTDNPRGTVNLSVHLVESSPGNPLLAEIGSYLAGEQVAGKIAGALKKDADN